MSGEKKKKKHRIWKAWRFSHLTWSKFCTRTVIAGNRLKLSSAYIAGPDAVSSSTRGQDNFHIFPCWPQPILVLYIKFYTLCTIYRSEESTEKVPEPEADVGECEGMVAGFPSLDVVAQGKFRSSWRSLWGQGWWLQSMLDLSSYNLSFDLIMQHSTKEAMFVAAMFTLSHWPELRQQADIEMWHHAHKIWSNKYLTILPLLFTTTLM